MEKLTLEICFKYFNAEIRSILGDASNKNITEWLFQKMVIEKWEIEQLITEITEYQLVLRPKEDLKINTPEWKELENICLKLNVRSYPSKIWMVKLPYLIADYLRGINIDIDRLEERRLAVYE